MEMSGQLHTLTALPLVKQSLVPIGYEAGEGSRADMGSVEEKNKNENFCPRRIEFIFPLHRASAVSQ